MGAALLALLAIGAAALVVARERYISALRESLSRLAPVPAREPTLPLPTWRLVPAGAAGRSRGGVPAGPRDLTALDLAREIARRGNVAVVRRDLGVMVEYPPAWREIAARGGLVTISPET